MIYKIIGNKHYPSHGFNIGSKVIKVPSGRYQLISDDPWPLEQWVNNLDIIPAIKLSHKIKVL